MKSKNTPPPPFIADKEGRNHMSSFVNNAWKMIKVSLLFGLGAFSMYNLTAWSIVTPPTPATLESIECQRFGKMNENFPSQYDSIALKEPYDSNGKFTGGCKGFIKKHSEAYPNKPPVPLKLEVVEAQTTQGKP